MSSLSERVHQIKEEQARARIERASKADEEQKELKRNHAEFDAFGQKLVTAFSADSLLDEFNSEVFKGNGHVQDVTEEVVYEVEDKYDSDMGVQLYKVMGKFRVSGKRLMSGSGDNCHSVFVGIVNTVDEFMSSTNDYNHPRFIVTENPDLGEIAWGGRRDEQLLGYYVGEMMRGTRDLSEDLINSGKKAVEDKLVVLAEYFLRPSTNQRGL